MLIIAVSIAAQHGSHEAETILSSNVEELRLGAARDRPMRHPSRGVHDHVSGFPSKLPSVAVTGSASLEASL